MNQRFIYGVLALALTLGATATGAEGQVAGNRPNVVYILADDLGYGDLGCYNKASKIPTPNLDRLAAQGMKFTDAHAPTAVCSPTRYAILTGRYSWRSKLQRGVLAPWDGPLIAANRLTVPKMLKSQGYTTACIGKWHLGWSWPTTDGKPAASGENRLSNVDFSKPIPDGPTSRGFDSYFGVDLPNFPPYGFIEGDRMIERPSVPDSGREDGFNRPGPMVAGWKLVNILPGLTKKAVSWVEEAGRSKTPFFLYFALTSPHYPVVPSVEFRGKTGAGDYGDFVAQTDWTIGQVLNAIERQGLAGNTLVIFTSDNGPEVTNEVKPGVYDRAEQYGHYSMGELRGAKRDAWEGGHRVPFLARWPGKIPANTTSDQTICHVDLMATLAAILGMSLPQEAGEDSVNILPVLMGKPVEGPIRESTIHQAASGKFAIRKGDWVLIDAPSGNDNGRGESEWFKKARGYQPHTQMVELFDLREDLAQHRNRAKERPELVKELKALLEKSKRDGRSTPGQPQKNDVPIGFPATPKKAAPKKAAR